MERWVHLWDIYFFFIVLPVNKMSRFRWVCGDVKLESFYFAFAERDTALIEWDQNQWEIELSFEYSIRWIPHFNNHNILCFWECTLCWLLNFQSLFAAIFGLIDSFAWLEIEHTVQNQLKRRKKSHTRWNWIIRKLFKTGNRELVCFHQVIDQRENICCRRISVIVINKIIWIRHDQSGISFVSHIDWFVFYICNKVIYTYPEDTIVPPTQ